MAYRHHRNIYVVAAGLQPSAVLDIVAVRHAVTIRQFSSQQECLQQLRRTSCEVLILDLGEPAETLAMLVQARELWPWQSSVVLVARGEVAQAVAAIKLGATDCLEKPVHQDRLLCAIEQALRRTAALFALNIPLTRAELTIVQLVLAGRTSKEIARQLNRSKRTIDVHREKIYRKLGVSNSWGVVRWAIAAGVIDRQANA